MLKFIAKLQLAIKIHIDAIDLDIEGTRLYEQAQEARGMLETYEAKIPELEAFIKVSHGDELTIAIKNLAEAKNVVTNAGNAAKNFLSTATLKRQRAADLREKISRVLTS